MIRNPKYKIGELVKIKQSGKTNSIEEIRIRPNKWNGYSDYYRLENEEREYREIDLIGVVNGDG